MSGRGKTRGPKPGAETETRTRAPQGPQLDRALLIAWLQDKARDEDELAEHVGREAAKTDRSESYRATLRGEVEGHHERARTFRGVAHGVERGDPDLYAPPDLPGRERRSSAAAALRPAAAVLAGSGEHAIETKPRP